MALHNGEKNQNQNTQSQPRPQAQPQLRGVGFGAASTSINRSFNRRPTSEIVQGYMNTLQGIVETVPGYKENTYDIRLIPIDEGTHAVQMSAIAIVRKEDNMVAVNVLGLAKTAHELADIVINRKVADGYTGSTQITYPQVPGDIWENSEWYRNAIHQIVRAEFAGLDVHVVGFMVLPATVEEDNVTLLRNALFRSIDATETFLQAQGKFDTYQLSFAELDPADKLVAKTEYNQPQSYTSFGQPIRSDVNVSCTVRRDSKNKDRPDEVVEVAVATGYVDAIYAGQDKDAVENSGVWTQKNIRTYVPAYVITSLDSGKDQNAVQPQHLIMALGSVQTLADRNRWANSFRPTHRDSALRDLGSLGIQMPLLGEMITDPTKFKTMGNADVGGDWVEFVLSAFYTGELNYFIDVEETGELSPLQSMIIDIANRDAGALDQFIYFADLLTDGCFSKCYDRSGAPILFQDIGFRVPLGTVKLDEKSDLDYDLRYIDTLALCSTERDIAEVEDVTDAIWSPEKDTDERTEIVTRYLNARFPGLVKYTGYARRISITPELLRLLDEAFAECGAVFQTEADFNIESHDRRSGGHWRANGYNATGAGSIASRSRGGQGNFRHRGSHNGWTGYRRNDRA